MTNPAFNRAAWEGTKPLVEPLPAPIEVGSVVWELTPEQRQLQRDTGDLDGDTGDTTVERRGGIVAKIARNPETGEMRVTILRARLRQGKFVASTFDVDASDLDGAIIEPRTPYRLHTAARQICRSLGETPSAFIAGYDRYLLELAVGLVVTAEDDAALAVEEKAVHHG